MSGTGGESGTRGFVPERPWPAQLAATLGMFVLGPAVGLGLAAWIAPGSVAMQALGLFAPALVMLFGFKLWLAHAAAILVGGVGRQLASGLWRVLVRKETVNPAEVMPPRERLEELAGRAVAACRAFRRVAWVVAVPAALLAVALAPDGRRLAAAAVFGLWLITYGALLTRLARAGYLAPPDAL